MIKYIILITGLVFTTPAMALDIYGMNRNQDEIRAYMWELQNDDTAVTRAVKNGKSKTQFCNTCHGKNGISKNPWEPNLAEQDATYLLDQLIYFANGKRKNIVMNDLASKLTDGELVDVALYYHKMKNTYVPRNLDTTQILKGKEIYNKTCATCHGPDGKGRAGFARLSGQKTEYLINNLNKFRSSNRRFSSTMGPIVDQLTRRDITAVATYITSLNIPNKE